MCRSQRSRECPHPSICTMESSAGSLRMRHNIQEVVGVAFNAKVKAPVIIDSRLPDVLCFVVLLGAEGRMAKVLEKENELLVKEPLDTGGSTGIAPFKGGRETDVHLLVLSFLAWRWR